MPAEIGWSGDRLVGALDQRRPVSDGQDQLATKDVVKGLGVDPWRPLDIFRLKLDVWGNAGGLNGTDVVAENLNVG